jgi:hypothetical protein
LLAVKRQEAMGDSSCEVRAQLLFDEAGHQLARFSDEREKSLELLANDGVQLGLFRGLASPGLEPQRQDEARSEERTR